jgi:hypothetical protein
VFVSTMSMFVPVLPPATAGDCVGCGIQCVWHVRLAPVPTLTSPPTVWIKVVDTDGNELGDVDVVEPVPAHVAALRHAVKGQWSHQLGNLDASQLKVLAAGADTAKDAPLIPPSSEPSSTYQAPLGGWSFGVQSDVFLSDRSLGTSVARR